MKKTQKVTSPAVSENIRRGTSKGMTIIETVIALAVIAVVSFTAISFIDRFSNVNAKMIYETDARLIVENSLECFKYAENETQFAGALSLVKSGFDRSGNNFIYSEHNFTVTLQVNFADAGGLAMFTGQAVDSSGKVIVRIESYVKEVAP